MNERRKPIHLPPKSCEISGRSLLGNEDKEFSDINDAKLWIKNNKDELKPFRYQNGPPTNNLTTGVLVDYRIIKRFGGSDFYQTNLDEFEEIQQNKKTINKTNQYNLNNFIEVVKNE